MVGLGYSPNPSPILLMYASACGDHSLLGACAASAARAAARLRMGSWAMACAACSRRLPGRVLCLSPAPAPLHALAWHVVGAWGRAYAEHEAQHWSTAARGLTYRLTLGRACARPPARAHEHRPRPRGPGWPVWRPRRRAAPGRPARPQLQGLRRGFAQSTPACARARTRPGCCPRPPAAPPRDAGTARRPRRPARRRRAPPRRAAAPRARPPPGSPPRSALPAGAAPAGKRERCRERIRSAWRPY